MRLTTAHRLDQETSNHERRIAAILDQDPHAAANRSLSPTDRYEALVEGVGMLGVKDLSTMAGWSVTQPFHLGPSPDSRRPLYVRLFLREGMIRSVAAHWVRNTRAPLPINHQEMVVGPMSRSIISAEYVELVQLDHTAGPEFEPMHDINRALAQLSLLEGSLEAAQHAAGIDPLATLRPAS